MDSLMYGLAEVFLEQINNYDRHRHLPPPRPSRLHTTADRINRDRHRSNMHLQRLWHPNLRRYDYDFPLGFDGQYAVRTRASSTCGHVSRPEPAQFLSVDPLAANDEGALLLR